MSLVRKRKKLPRTPRSIVRNRLRLLFLHSRERHTALKRDKYQCVKCGVKQSTARGHEQRVEVDHLDGVEWEELIDLIYERLLVSPEKLQTLCESDHAEKTLVEKLGRENRA